MFITLLILIKPRFPLSEKSFNTLYFQVRNERNKAREEAKMLRSKLDSALKDSNTFKREKQELETQNEQMRKELEKIHLLLLKHAGQWDHQLLEALEHVDPERDIPLSIEDVCELDHGVNEEDRTSVEKDSGIEEYVLQGAVPRHAVEMYEGKDGLDRDGDSLTLCEENELSGDVGSGDESGKQSASQDEEILRQKLSMLQLRLDEATKTLQVERE